MERQSRLIAETQAAEFIKDNMTVFVGGFSLSSHPMAIVRQIIKSGVKDLTVVGAATTSIEIDIMIAAGIVKCVVAPYVGAEGHIAICPVYRACAQSGEIDVWEVDEAMYYTALRAGSLELPFLPDRVGVGTDYPKLNPDLKEFIDPINGEPLIAVKAIAPDVALIYAAASDVYGNVQFNGSGFGDRTGVRASKICIVQAEKIISNEEIKMNPQATSLHGMDYVIRSPYGAHPFSSPGCYLQDDKFIAEYIAAGKEFLSSGNRRPLDGFLDKWIYGPKTHLEYLEIVGLKRLFSLYEY
jgi:glutaconate CoA-transferase subunit A